MAIYIKGMEMPNCCAQCSFETLFSDDIHYCTAKEIAEEIHTEDYWRCRPSFCPITEVSEPHGRLIDADSVMRNNLFTERDRGFLNDAPTVIERN